MDKALADLVLLVGAELKDTGEVSWTDEELTDHIRAALMAYSLVAPRRVAVDLVAIAATREYDLSDETEYPGLLEIIDIWYPYDPLDPVFPPNRPAWSVPASNVLSLDVNDEPTGATDEQIRLFYTALHTIEDLDSADATTLSDRAVLILVTGAAAKAALQLAQSVIGTVTVSSWTPRHFREWADNRWAEFKASLELERQRAVLTQDGRIAPHPSKI